MDLYLEIGVMKIEQIIPQKAEYQKYGYAWLQTIRNPLNSFNNLVE